MMKNRRFYLCFWLFILLGVMLPKAGWGFDCTDYSRDVSVAATVFTDVYNAKGTSVITGPGVIRGCSGQVNSSYQDAMRVRSVNYHSSLADFTRILKVTGGNSHSSSGMTGVGTALAISSSNLCVWPNTSCSTSAYSGTKNTLDLTLTLQGEAKVLAAGPLATVILERRSKTTNGFNSETYTITYTLATKVEPPVFTCAINNYDATITLPDVSRDDILSSGGGRYTLVSRPLTMALQCNPNTRVSIKFTGTAMSDTDDVLKNNLAGNDNVGFQLLFNSNVVKLNDTLQVISSAVAQQTLTFDTYYYYRGSNTSVSGGSIKSSAEFLFTYQ